MQDLLMISLIEIKFAKHFCTIEVVYHFIKDGHEVSFLGYSSVSFPHVHAQLYSTRLFGLGYQDHRGYPGGGSISGFNNILSQQGFNTSFKILSLMKWDTSVRLMNRSHILINMQFDLNILHLSKTTEKTSVTLEYIPFHRHSICNLQYSKVCSSCISKKRCFAIYHEKFRVN